MTLFVIHPFVLSNKFRIKDISRNYKPTQTTTFETPTLAECLTGWSNRNIKLNKTFAEYDDKIDKRKNNNK